MSFVRRAVALSIGVAAGAGSAPYLCPSTAGSSGSSLRPSSLADLWGQSLWLESGKLRSRDESVSHWPENAVPVRGEGGMLCAVGAGTACVIEAVARGAARVRAAMIGGAHEAALAASDSSAVAATSSAARENPPSTISSESGTVSEAAVNTSAFRAVPHKLKDRFLRYAQRDAETGEFVLTLDGFVRCMLLLPDAEVNDAAPIRLYDAHTDDTRSGGTAAASVATTAYPGQPQRLSSPSSWFQRLSPAVQRRFLHFFHCVDLDGTNSIGYAEFVVLFTFLSTRRQTLERAFHVFDLDDNGRLSEREFCRLLNTIMVDPAVQVTYSPTAKEEDGHRSGTRDTGLSASTASRAGESRSSVRQRQKYKKELNFEIASELMRPLLFGPLPKHMGAPPGSMHYHDASSTASSFEVMRQQHGSGPASQSGNEVHGEASPAPHASLTTSTSVKIPNSANPHLTGTSTSWWRTMGCKMQLAWWQLVKKGDTVLSSPPAGVPLPSHVAELQRMAEQDTLLQSVSYPTFLYRMDYLRWELRAIEFGLCDPANRGFISFEDCRMLLGRDRRALAAGSVSRQAPTKAAASSPPPDHAAGDGQSAEADTDAPDGTVFVRSTPVTWQVYQKIFDVIKESNTILPALQLMLDSLPPVPEDVLRGGAIPDAELKPATLAVQAVVEQTVLRYTSGDSAKGSGSEPEDSDSGNRETSKKTPDAAGAAQERYNEETFGLTSDPSKPSGEARTSARRLQATLVRPTALTWMQFSQALSAVGTIPRLTRKEEALFRALLDDDASNSLSPTEFAHMCIMKESFFAEYLPRFDEPKRNAVQQFFYCMQQLD